MKALHILADNSTAIIRGCVFAYVAIGIVCLIAWASATAFPVSHAPAVAPAAANPPAAYIRASEGPDARRRFL